MKTIKLTLAATLLLFLAACGNGGFEGDYEAAAGMQEFSFKSDGRLVQSMGGSQVGEFKFEKDGDEIKVFVNDNASQIFTLQTNGELVGPGGVTLTPK